jgi:hypothetical protein
MTGLLASLSVEAITGLSPSRRLREELGLSGVRAFPGLYARLTVITVRL